MRRAAKRDDNEALIVTALQSAGWTVVRVSDAGAPDLLVARNGVLTLMEVKGPKGTLTPAQEVAFERLAGAGVQVQVVRSPDEALTVVGAPYAACRWLAANGTFLCEHCWIAENGLHAKDCPSRTALKPKPKVQSAHRAAQKMEEAMPKKHVRLYDRDLNLVHEQEVPEGTEQVVFRGTNSVMTTEGLVYRDENGFTIDLRPSRGVEGELRPIKVKR